MYVLGTSPHHIGESGILAVSGGWVFASAAGVAVVNVTAVGHTVV